MNNNQTIEASYASFCWVAFHNLLDLFPPPNVSEEKSRSIGSPFVSIGTTGCLQHLSNIWTPCLLDIPHHFLYISKNSSLSRLSHVIMLDMSHKRQVLLAEHSFIMGMLASVLSALVSLASKDFSLCCASKISWGYYHSCCKIGKLLSTIVCAQWSPGFLCSSFSLVVSFSLRLRFPSRTID